jgi:Alpha/beta hydrolase domain
MSICQLVACVAGGAAMCLSLGSVTCPGSVAGAAVTSASVPAPTVEGPISPSSGISFLGSTLFPPSTVGYEQSEFFLSGNASSYTSASPLAKNGQWSVKSAGTAPYKTRVVVYRPSNPKRFDGTVVVEWLNVTAGIDAPAAWLNSHIQMIRDGMAYVGVDAQAGGINGEADSIAVAAGAGGIKQSDPTRYGSLQHPGDSYSYSIYQQAGEALHASGAQLLGGLHPKRILAMGESQSAFRMVTYINALQRRSPGIYDAYFVYSRGGNSSDLSQPPQATITTPTPTYIRTDLHVPVFLFETETDLLDLGYLAARQPATHDIREWETAGTAHDDTYGLLYARSDTGDGKADAEAFQSMSDPPSDPISGIVDCGAPVNTGSHTYELRAALAGVNRWMTSGAVPRQSPRLEVDPANRHAFLTDRNGNASGGIRSPQVEAPVAALSGTGQPGSTSLGTQPSNADSISSGTLCSILGTTAPLSTARLSALYPTHAAFVTKWDAATAVEVREGYLLPADARSLDQVAAKSTVGG